MPTVSLEGCIVLSVDAQTTPKQLNTILSTTIVSVLASSGRMDPGDIR